MSKLLFAEVSVEQQEIVVGGVVGGAVTTSSLSSLSQILGPTTLSYITSYVNSAKIPASVSPILLQLATNLNSIGL